MRAHFIGPEPQAREASFNSPGALCRLLNLSLCLGPCLLLLDSLHLARQVGHSHRAVMDQLDWLPPASALHPATRIVVTVVRPSAAPEPLVASLQRRGEPTRTVVIEQLESINDRTAVLQAQLALHCKALDKHPQDTLLHSKLSCSPSFIRLFVGELLHCGEYDLHMQAVIASYLKEDSMEGVFRQMVTRCACRIVMPGVSDAAFGRWVDSLNYSWVTDALRLLCVAYFGLRIDELIQILGTLGFDPAQLLQDCAFFVVFAKEGLCQRPLASYDFVSLDVRAAVMQQFFSTGEAEAQRQRSSCHTTLFQFFSTQPPSEVHAEALCWQEEELHLFKLELSYG